MARVTTPPSDDRRVLPYGEWPSPISAELLTRATGTRPTPMVDGGAVYALQTRPETGAVVHLVRLGRGGDDDSADAGAGPAGPVGPDVSPAEVSVGSRVHEYGGGEYAVRDGVILAVDRPTQRLWRLDGTPRPLTAEVPDARVRFAAMEIDVPRGIAYAVREDHRGVPGERPEPVNALVRIPLDAQPSAAAGAAAPTDDATGTPLTIGRRAGHEGGADPDFVIDPVLSPDGARLAWVQWRHPEMPWDAGEVWVGELDGRGDVTDARRVAGGVDRAAYEPVWVGPDRLAVLDERTGWFNPYLVDVTAAPDPGESDAPAAAATPLHAVAEEYGGPPWVPRLRMMTALPDGRLAAVRWVGGFAQLTLLDPAKAGTPEGAQDLGPRRALADFLSVADSADGPGTRVVLRSLYPDRPAAVVAVDPDTGAEEVRWRYGQEVPAGYAPQPRRIEWPGEGGATAYGFLYLPTHPEVAGPVGDRPPLVVQSHGGPTASAYGALSAAVAYWTSRGVAVLDVDYGGSTGSGRAYRERLAGNWGIVDVGDCVRGARHLADTGVVDPARLAIRGASAGGYIVLAALAFHDVFTAGVSLFGVSDLGALARDTHKFESRYPYRLVGPWPDAEATYRERSPLFHVERLATPLLLLQGSDDKIVPPDQARLMADAVRAKGVPVALIEFPGEGHGFREPANVIRTIEAETSFLAQVWGYTPADDIAPVPIDNLG